jgi:hypothetical protein
MRTATREMAGSLSRFGLLCDGFRVVGKPEVIQEGHVGSAEIGSKMPTEVNSLCPNPLLLIALLPTVYLRHGFGNNANEFRCIMATARILNRK